MSKIPLSVVAGKAFVWKVDHAERLRTEHHICGLLTGTLPQLSQQNVFLGMPLQLLPEEVVLLVNKGLALLVDEQQAHKPAAPAQRDSFNAQREASITEQKRTIALQNMQHKKAMEAKFADQINAKRAQRAAKRAEAALTASKGTDDPQSELAAFSAPEEQQQTDVTGKSAAAEHQNLEDVPYPVHIRGHSDGLPWYQPQSYAFHSLESAKEAGLWHFPSTEEERSRCIVFQDLWEKGNFMGNGLRFGGDFLVYPDDPLRYHSHFSTTVFRDSSVPVSPTDIVSSGRLATAVKKAHLLCAPDQKEPQRVHYFSLEWAGMG